jgi:co-chaperonin GroES (HSP10)
MTTQTVVPVGKKVLIKQKEAEMYYPGTNIMIPETARKKECKGTVVGVGGEVTEISVGDYIMYADYAVPTSLIHNGEEHLLINAGDVFVIFK